MTSPCFGRSGWEVERIRRLATFERLLVEDDDDVVQSNLSAGGSLRVDKPSEPPG